MDVELIEIREFLAEHPPFSDLPDELLDRLPRQLAVRYLRRGSVFPPPDIDSALYLVRRGALESRDAGGRLLDRYGEGDFFTAGCAVPEPEKPETVVLEDTLFYVLPCDRFDELRRHCASFDAHFEASVNQRLRHAIDRLQQAPGGGLPLDIPVAGLSGRVPVTADPQVPIRDGARLMTREGVSALLVMERDRLVGIVTDRDLRARCLAADRDPGEPLATIMTDGVESIAHEAPAFEALLTMTRLDVHHLPVLDGDRIAGVISASDLVQYQSTNAVYLANDIRRAESAAELAEVGRRLPELQQQLVAAGISGHHLGQAVTAVIDALTHRHIELAEAEFGKPPVPYVWLVGGSQGRREQTVLTDQDSALLLDEHFEPEIHERWFDRFTERVTDGLAECGLPRCPGAVTARNPEWRHTVRGWHERLQNWIGEPTAKNAMLAVNFFDMRPLHGAAGEFEQLYAEAVRKAADSRIFVGRMVENALRQRPPLGFFRNFVLDREGEQAPSLDIKRRGLVPLADVARIHTLAAGRVALGTDSRLAAAVDAGTLSRSGSADLSDALELLATLRIRHQTTAIRRGQAPDNHIDPRHLSHLERRHLKDAFTVLSEHQRLMAQVYGTGKLD